MSTRRILVTKEEYERQQELVRSLENEVSLMEEEVRRYGAERGKIAIPREEYERRLRRIRSLNRRLEEERSRWGRYMARLRYARRRREKAAYLGLIRQSLRRIRSLQRKISNARKRLRRFIPIPEEMARRLEALRRRLAEEKKRLENMVIGNKLIAMHKRWQYKSRLGKKKHDISIEAVASMVIPPDERKEDYEDMLKGFLEDEMFSTEGFEKLSGLEEKVLGFEEVLTAEAPREPRLETLEWWHEVFEEPRLSLRDYMEVVEAV